MRHSTQVIGEPFGAVPQLGKLLANGWSILGDLIGYHTEFHCQHRQLLAYSVVQFSRKSPSFLLLSLDEPTCEKPQCSARPQVAAKEAARGAARETAKVSVPGVRKISRRPAAGNAASMSNTCAMRGGETVR